MREYSTRYETATKSGISITPQRRKALLQKCSISSIKKRMEQLRSAIRCAGPKSKHRLRAELIEMWEAVVAKEK